jgi:capsular exopolysaccharide synthesis family protein
MADHYTKKNGYDDSVNESSFDIFRILKILKKNIIPVLIICIICIAVMVWLSIWSFKETYTSSGSFLVNPKIVNADEELGEYGISASSLNLSTQLAVTYKELLTSDTVMINVAEECDLTLTPNELRNFISIGQTNGTGVIKVYATTEDPELSKRIVEGLLTVLPKFIDKTMGFGKIEVIDRPLQLSSANENYNAIIYPIIGFAVGLLISFIWAIIKDLLTNTVRNSSDIKKKIGTPLLATIPYKAKTKDTRKLLVDSAHADFDFVEASKHLRARVESILINQDKKRVMVTSTYQDEGKTTTAVNLAISLSKMGKNVVVIDADLRRPAVADTLCVNTDGKKGLVQYFNHDATWKEVTKFVRSHGIFVVLSGGVSEDPAEMLGSEDMDTLLRHLETEFDYIIIDTPPEKVVSDAMALAPKIDAALIVIKQEYADVNEINEVIDDINSDGQKVVGCVYNSLDRSSEKRYGIKSKKYFGYRYNRYNQN